ncbi:unnamed protein product [Trichogramma brassicae]|uniref:Uncharacterized protein n=1 Tax=Trichogramma brassicae TaxID=86971 RepID=A0A6H5J0L6_9HYME|nr:unnamed protein product [Trichogramma brassicae]
MIIAPQTMCGSSRRRPQHPALSACVSAFLPGTAATSKPHRAARSHRHGVQFNLNLIHARRRVRAVCLDRVRLAPPKLASLLSWRKYRNAHKRSRAVISYAALLKRRNQTPASQNVVKPAKLAKRCAHVHCKHIGDRLISPDIPHTYLSNPTSWSLNNSAGDDRASAHLPGRRHNELCSCARATTGIARSSGSCSWLAEGGENASATLECYLDRKSAFFQKYLVYEHRAINPTNRSTSNESIVDAKANLLIPKFFKMFLPLFSIPPYTRVSDLRGSLFEAFLPYTRFLSSVYADTRISSRIRSSIFVEKQNQFFLSCIFKSTVVQ